VQLGLERAWALGIGVIPRERRPPVQGPGVERDPHIDELKQLHRLVRDALGRHAATAERRQPRAPVGREEQERAGPAGRRILVDDDIGVEPRGVQALERARSLSLGDPPRGRRETADRPAMRTPARPASMVALTGEAGATAASISPPPAKNSALALGRAIGTSLAPVVGGSSIQRPPGQPRTLCQAPPGVRGR